MVNHQKIPVYVHSCSESDDEFGHLYQRFSRRNEFLLYPIDDKKTINKELRLLQSIKNSIRCAIERDQELIIVCNTHHHFTYNYSLETFIDIIDEGTRLDADILIGGIRWCNSAFQVTDNLYWIDSFTGIYFLVIYQKSFQKILQSTLIDGQEAHAVLSALSQQKFLIHPFISAQEDLTSPENENSSIANEDFNPNKLIYTLKDIAHFYKINPGEIVLTDLDEQIVIPTYIINLPERSDRLAHIIEQFNGRNEFSTTIVEACPHQIGAVGLWLSIRKVIEMAIANDDDVIVICEDDHQFTPEYSRDYFFKNLLEAYSQATDYLNGGIAWFDNGIMVAESRFWTDRPTCTQFIVIYKSFYQKILDAPYDDTVLADVLLAKLTANKLVLHPFISTQFDFGYSDVTPLFNNNNGLVGQAFVNCDKKFNLIKEAFRKYKSNKN